MTKNSFVAEVTFKNKHFLFKSCKNKHKKGKVGKAKKGKAVVVST